MASSQAFEGMAGIVNAGRLKAGWAGAPGLADSPPLGALRKPAPNGWKAVFVPAAGGGAVKVMPPNAEEVTWGK